MRKCAIDVTAATGSEDLLVLGLWRGRTSDFLVISSQLSRAGDLPWHEDEVNHAGDSLRHDCHGGKYQQEQWLTRWALNSDHRPLLVSFEL
jgi:hypothetical protein